MLFTALLMVLLLLVQGDTTVADTAATGTGVGIGGFFVGYILKNVVPLASAWLFQWWNTKVGSWYATLSSPVLKMAVYVGATMVFMFLFSIVGLGWDATTDPSNLGPEFFQNLVMSLVSTFLVKVGIKTEQARSGTAGGGVAPSGSSSYNR